MRLETRVSYSFDVSRELIPDARSGKATEKAHRQHRLGVFYCPWLYLVQPFVKAVVISATLEVTGSKFRPEPFLILDQFRCKVNRISDFFVELWRKKSNMSVWRCSTENLELFY